MYEKYRVAAFGRCPHVFCQGQPVLPVGLSDLPRNYTVNVFCPRCHGLFFPKSTRQANIDGAYFGTTFPHLYLMTHPVRLFAKCRGLPSVCEYLNALSPVNTCRKWFLPSQLKTTYHVCMALKWTRLACFTRIERMALNRDKYRMIQDNPGDHDWDRVPVGNNITRTMGFDSSAYTF